MSSTCQLNVNESGPHAGFGALKERQQACYGLSPCSSGVVRCPLYRSVHYYNNIHIAALYRPGLKQVRVVQLAYIKCECICVQQDLLLMFVIQTKGAAIMCCVTALISVIESTAAAETGGNQRHLKKANPYVP